MIKLDIFQKPDVNALRTLRKVQPLPSHEHYYMSNATITNYFTILLQIVVMANYYQFSFGPTTNITISISNNHFWWAFCDFGLDCLLLHQAQVFWIRELGLVQLQLTLVQPMYKLCPVFRNFSHMPMAGEVATEELWQINAINNGKRNTLLLGKISKRSLIKTGKENTLQAKLYRQNRKQQQ